MGTERSVGTILGLEGSYQDCPGPPDRTSGSHEYGQMFRPRLGPRMIRCPLGRKMVWIESGGTWHDRATVPFP